MMRGRIGVCVLACSCILLSFPRLALSDDIHEHHHVANERLGNVSFPISCASVSQKPFERGVALMHSFG